MDPSNLEEPLLVEDGDFRQPSSPMLAPPPPPPVPPTLQQRIRKAIQKRLRFCGDICGAICGAFCRGCFFRLHPRLQIRIIIAVIVSFFTLCLTLERNAGCSPETLKTKTPPFGGELFPDNILLTERRNQLFQFSKIIDVYDVSSVPIAERERLRSDADDSINYDHPLGIFWLFGITTLKEANPDYYNNILRTENWTRIESLPHLGYFYDLDFLLFMRFGYSDKDDQIWFEVRYRNWMDRFFLATAYTLERCDSGLHRNFVPNDNNAGSDLKFDILRRYWDENGGEGGLFCAYNCEKLFDIERYDDTTSKLSNTALSAAKPAANPPHLVAHARFNSTRQILDDYTDIYVYEHQWSMSIVDPRNTTVLAQADQFFGWGSRGTGYQIFSRWNVGLDGKLNATKHTKKEIPNWVLAFMAALDDVESGE